MLLSHKSSFVCFHLFICFNILLVNIVILIEQIAKRKKKAVTLERKETFFLWDFFPTYIMP